MILLSPPLFSHWSIPLKVVGNQKVGGVWNMSNCPNLARTAAIEVRFSLNFAVVFDFKYFRFRPNKAKMNRHCPTELAKRCKFFPSFIMRIAYWRSESVRVPRQSAESCKKSPRNTNWKLKTLQYCCALPNGARGIVASI
jgi:hypothetical protein